MTEGIWKAHMEITFSDAEMKEMEEMDWWKSALHGMSGKEKEEVQV